jgi:hypothetical protein
LKTKDAPGSERLHKKALKTPNTEILYKIFENYSGEGNKVNTVFYK